MTQTTDTKAGKAFRRWADKEGAGYRDLARRLDADPGQLWRILHGKRLPGLALAFRIQDATGIDARGWVR